MREPLKNGKVVAIFVGPVKQEPMKRVRKVCAIPGAGLEGDRYAETKGSYSNDVPGKRQVTLINAQFFPGTGYTYMESRRNIVVRGVELNNLIGRMFKIGEATFIGEEYCDPCEVPKNLANKKMSFREAFFDRGGIIAKIIEGGEIKQGDEVITLKKVERK